MNLRKLVVAPLAGFILMGAVGGSAATITNTVPKLGATTDSVASCDTTVTSAWDSAYDATLGKYEVTTLTVSALDGVACADATMKVTLTDSANAVLGSEKTATIASTDTSKSFSFAADNVPAGDVAKANVVIVGA